MPLCALFFCVWFFWPSSSSGRELGLSTSVAAEFLDSEFPWLSPACFDEWKFLRLLSGLSTLGTPPSILTPPPHHLLLWLKNDHGESSGFSVLDWMVEHPDRIEVAVVPSGP